MYILRSPHKADRDKIMILEITQSSMSWIRTAGMITEGGETPFCHEVRKYWIQRLAGSLVSMYETPTHE